MAPPTGTPKQMSSRLLTMKFMQRSAASPSSSEPQTPNTTEPPSKKQRLSNGTINTPPSATRTPEQQAVDKALADEERKRNAALERQARDAGETKWVLNYKEPEVGRREKEPGFEVVNAGFSTIDADGAAGSEDEDEDGAGFKGRQSFGNFKGGGSGGAKRKFPESGEGEDEGENSSEDESSSEEEDEDDPTGASAMIKEARKEAGAKARAERKAQKQAEKADAQRMAGERRKKSININKGPDRGPLAQSGGISSGGGGGGGGSTKSKDCYICGKVGHIAKECPKQKGNNKKR
ncbi:hypothetical protein MBLNU230_g0481t1 [Neophaeotheca triangularis]